MIVRNESILNKVLIVYIYVKLENYTEQQLILFSYNFQSTTSYIVEKTKHIWSLYETLKYLNKEHFLIFKKLARQNI